MKMELLSPAGDREALLAAVRAGADAVYLGGQTLNARRSAGNFDAEGLKWAADTCHERGRKVYVTVNTMLRQDELGELEALAAQLYAAGADGAIIQDLGCAAALNAMLPGLALHASTQMAIHNPQGVRFLRQNGFSRVVLARELTFEEIAQCAAEGLEIEAFGHGALCVACSGQCLFSSLVGGRSGNRGMCAQPCRLPYALSGAAISAEGALLSPRDLCQLSNLPALRRAGVCSLKLEGRLKKPEYVSIITRVYREALDRMEAGDERLDGDWEPLLRAAFNRDGFTRGYGPGVVDRELMCNPAAAGQPRSDAAVMERERASLSAPEASVIPLRGTLTLRVGQPVRLELSDGTDTAVLEGASVQQAQSRPTEKARAAAQIEKTGGTPYRVEALEVDMDAAAFVPVSALNALRRDTLNALAQLRIARNRPKMWLNPLPSLPVAAEAEGVRPLLCVQSADVELLRQASAWGADEIVYAPENLTQLTPPEGEFALALPMTARGEDMQALNEWAWEYKERLRCVLISNPGQLALQWPGALRGDYPLGAANNWTARRLSEWGLQSYAPSVELTARQIEALEGEKELIVFGRLPLMALRHCPLNAQLGGGPHASCTRCDKVAPPMRLNAQRFIDRKGVSFPLQRIKTRGGCIVQVLNSVPLMLLRHARRLPDSARWRLLLDSDEGAEIVVRAHRRALDGGNFRETPGWDTWESRETTTGHYFRGVE